MYVNSVRLKKENDTCGRQGEDHFDEQGHKVTHCLLLDFLWEKDSKQDVNKTNKAIF